MSPSNVVITGCNRGIGLELVKRYLKSPTPPEHLVATYRDPDRSKDLLDLVKTHKNLHPIQLDLSKADPKVFDEFAAKVAEVVGRGEGINLLINNAGMGSQDQHPTVETMREVYEVNCLSPYFLTLSLLPLIKYANASRLQLPMGIDRAAVVMMSSILSSITLNETDHPTGWYTAYRASKAALNMVMKNLSLELKSDGILVVSMHPGWVRTDMGGPEADIDVQTCCSNMLGTLQGLTERNNGELKTYNDNVLAW